MSLHVRKPTHPAVNKVNTHLVKTGGCFQGAGFTHKRFVYLGILKVMFHKTVADALAFPICGIFGNDSRIVIHWKQAISTLQCRSHLGFRRRICL